MFLGDLINQLDDETVATEKLVKQHQFVVAYRKQAVGDDRVMTDGEAGVSSSQALGHI